MADTSIAVTPSTAPGAQPVDTRTQPNGDHREVVTVGDPSTTTVAGVNVSGALTVGELVAGTASRSPVASVVNAVQVLAANPLRRGCIAVNESTATLFVCYGSAGTATDYTYSVGPGGTWVMDSPPFTGPIFMVWSTANGYARVTELAV